MSFNAGNRKVNAVRMKMPRVTAKKPLRKRRARVAGRKLTHSEDGVDRTLIRWMLSMTPAQRLRVLQRHVASIFKLRSETKEETAGEKDKAVLPLLRRTLEQKARTPKAGE
jgi:hypothetical protein